MYMFLHFWKVLIIAATLEIICNELIGFTFSANHKYIWLALHSKVNVRISLLLNIFGRLSYYAFWCKIYISAVSTSLACKNVIYYSGPSGLSFVIIIFSSIPLCLIDICSMRRTTATCSN